MLPFWGMQFNNTPQTINHRGLTTTISFIINIEPNSVFRDLLKKKVIV